MSTADPVATPLPHLIADAIAARLMRMGKLSLAAVMYDEAHQAVAVWMADPAHRQAVIDDGLKIFDLFGVAHPLLAKFLRSAVAIVLAALYDAELAKLQAHVAPPLNPPAAA